MRLLLILALLPLLPLLAHSAEPPTGWYKGNLHTHTLWSDGNDYPDMVAAWYKDHGYHFLGLSDHNIIANEERWVSIEKNKGGQPAFDKYLAKYGPKWVETRDGEKGKEVRLKMLSEFRQPVEAPGKFLMISMEEITSQYVHINATNIREVILPYTGGSKKDAVTSEIVVKAMQYGVGAVYEQRQRLGVPMFPHINHPNYKWQLTAEELLEVKQDQFFEVFNGHHGVNNAGDEQHPSTDRLWDILLTSRLGRLKLGPLYGLGTDDSHNYHDQPGTVGSHPGRGFVVVHAAKLDTPALIAAMEAGDFYASSGIILKDIRREKTAYTLEIATEPGVTYTTEFIGTRKGYNPKAEPIPGPDGKPLRVTQKYSAEIGAVLATATGPKATYTLKGNEIYVRARVTSSKQMSDPPTGAEVEQAWTQPLIGPAAL